MPRTRAYAGRLVRLWWLVGLAALVAGGTAWGVARVRQPLYQAEATVILRAAPGLPIGSDLAALVDRLDAGTLPNTLVAVIGSPSTATEAAARAGLTPAQAGDYDISAAVGSNGRLIQVRVSGPDPARATALVGAAIDAARQSVERLYRLVTIEMLERATQPSAPVRPDPVHDVPLAAGLGGLLGLLLAVLLDYIANDKTQTLFIR